MSTEQKVAVKIDDARYIKLWTVMGIVCHSSKCDTIAMPSTSDHLYQSAKACKIPFGHSAACFIRQLALSEFPVFTPNIGDSFEIANEPSSMQVPFIAPAAQIGHTSHCDKAKTEVAAETSSRQPARCRSPFSAAVCIKQNSCGKSTWKCQLKHIGRMLGADALRQNHRQNYSAEPQGRTTRQNIIP